MRKDKALWISICILLVASRAIVLLSSQSDRDLKTAGRVDGILIGSERYNRVSRDSLSVLRQGNEIEGECGMPLCYGDTITTGAGVSAVLRMGESAQEEKIFTLSQKTTITIEDRQSLFLRIGRLFASLRGMFTVVTNYYRLGAKGTEFQAEVTEDGLEVIQLEGNVEATRTDEIGDLREFSSVRVPRGSGYLRSDLLGPSLGLLPLTGMEKRENVAHRGQPPKADPAYRQQAGRPTRMRLPPGSAPQVEPADKDVVFKTIDANCTVIIGTRPEFPSQNMIMAYDSQQSRASAYRDARFGTIWTPESIYYFEQLGNVYADWADAWNALRALKGAESVKRGTRESAIYLNSLGNAYRLAGDFREAEQKYNQALKADPQFAFPFNGLGDVMRDEALVAIDAGQRETANNLFNTALRYYRRSLEPNLWGKEAGPNRAVPFTNIGSVHLRLAEVLETDGKDPREIQKQLDEAAANYSLSLGETGNNPFAMAGRAKTAAVLARCYQKQGNSAEAARSLALAESELKEVVKQFPAFAVGWHYLADVSMQAGKPEEAKTQLQHAIQADPHYAQAYRRLADTVVKENPPQASLYYQSYLREESPAFQNGIQVSAARVELAKLSGSIPPRETKPLPKSMPVPDLRRHTLEQVREQLRGNQSWFIVGSIKGSTEPAGTVTDQDPKPGDMKAPGTAINLTVAAPIRQDKLQVPDFHALTVLQVRDRLQNRQRDTISLILGSITERESSQAAGTVLSQSIKPGTRVAPGTVINIVIARPPETITVPDLRGLTEAQVHDRMQGLQPGKRSLALGSIRQRESNAPAGTVLSQSIKPGTQVAPGAVIDIVIARPLDTIRVPDFRRQTEKQVRASLARAQQGTQSLIVGRVTEQESNLRPGTVIGQDPKPGTPVPVGSSIDLIVARAKPVNPGVVVRTPPVSLKIQVKVPNVLGRLLRDATDTLDRAGLKYEVSGKGPYVRGQAPKAGELVTKGSTVTLTLAR